MLLPYLPYAAGAIVAALTAVLMAQAGYGRYILDLAIVVGACLLAPRVAAPAWLLLPVAALIGGRHWPWRRSTGAGAWLARAAVPGMVVLGGSGTGFWRRKTSSVVAVPAQQNRVNPTEPGILEPAIRLIAQHNLEPRQAAELLAQLKRPDGAYYMSANAIRDAVGGNAATVKGWVADKRSPAEMPAGRQGRWEINSNGEWVKVR